MAATLAMIFFYIFWQIAYRRGALPEDAPWARGLAWTASIDMGLWSTFFVVALITNLVGLALLLTGHRRAIEHTLPLITALATSLIAFLGMGQALAGPKIKSVEIKIEDLPKSLDGLRIAQISDLHIGATIRRGYIQQVVNQTLALKPDLIAVTGDMADGTPKRLNDHVQPLSALKAPLGVYYVTGNHEYYWDAKGWIEAVKKLGFIPLLNENRKVQVDGATLLIGGITDDAGTEFMKGHAPNIQKAWAGGEHTDFRLLLAHRPGVVSAAEKAGFQLQLSGHTHGGQFFPASLFIPFFHRYYRGLSRHGRLWIYVNPGTGYWGPVQRFAIPSEITCLTLRSG